MDLKTTVQSLLKRLDRPAPDRHVRFRALVRRVVRRQLRIHLLLFLDQCRSIATRWQAMNLPGWPLDGRFRLAIGGMSRASFYLERLEPRLHFTWIGATSGNANNAAHDYDNLLNWLGGIIDNNFSTVTLSSNTTIYVPASTPTLGGLNLGYAGNYDLTFESSSSTAQTLTLNGGITGDFGGSANDRTVSFGSASNPLNLNLGGGSRTLNVNSGDTLLVQNSLSNGTLIKTGNGTLTLRGANTYAGGTTLSAGTLDINDATALGTGTLTIDGGTTIDNTSGSAITLSNNNAQIWNGDFTFTGTNDLNLGIGDVTMESDQTITVNGGNLTVGGDIAGGANSLSVAGPATLILSGTNIFSGGLTVNSGLESSTTVRATSSGAVGSGTILIGLEGNDTTSKLELSGDITISNAIILDGRDGSTSPGIESISGDNTLSGTVSLQVGGSYFPIQADSGSLLTLSAANSIHSVVGSNRVVTLLGSGAGIISGTITQGAATVSVQADQTGDWTLSGANTISGGVTLNSGTLNIDNPTAIGSGTLTINGGIIDNTSGSAISLSDNNAQSWNGNFTFAGTDDLNLGTGAVTMGASRTVTIANGNLAVGGDIAGGSNTLSVSGSGRLTLSGANTLGSVSIADLTGGTSIVRATSSSALGSGTVVINGASTDGTLELSGGITVSNPISFWGRSAAAIGIESVSGDNTLSGAITIHTGGSYYPIQSDSGAGLTLSNSTLLASTPTGSRIINLQGGGVGAISGAITNDSAVVSVNDLSTGAWTLSGANTFSGGNTIDAGTELVNNTSGSGTGSGNVTVNSGGILGGDGIITGAVNVNAGGTLSPGSGGTAIFATGNLTIAPGGDLDVVVNSSTPGSGYDQLDVTGTVNLAGATLNLSGNRPIHLGDQITLISNDAADAVAGTFNGLPEGAAVTLDGANYKLNYEGGDGNDVVLTDNGPYVATAALATPAPVTGTFTDLSVLGSDEAGEPNLTYLWSVTSVPPGAADPTFSVNDSNAAKNTVATFTAAGTYVFEATITDPGGSSTTSSVSVTVDQTLTSLSLAPVGLTVKTDATQQFTASGLDQFGQNMTTLPTLSWSATGGGSINSAGLYTAPSSAATATIHAANGSVNASTGVTIISGANIAPTVTLPASQSVAEDAPLTFSTAGGNAITVGDVDGGNGIEDVTLIATNGTVTLATDANITFVQGTGTNDTAGIYDGTLTDLNAALNGLVFTPNSHFVGTATLDVWIDDLGNSGSGGALTTMKALSITVTAVAHTPSVTAASTNEDTQSTSGLVISPNTLDGSLSGDFQITGITGGSLYESDGVTPITDGQFITFAQGEAGLQFNPTADSTTSGAFDVQASTSNSVGGLGGSVVAAAITVNPVPTLAMVATAMTNEDAALTFSNADSNAITLGDPGNSAGPASVTLTATDGTLSLASVAGITISIGSASGASSDTITGSFASLDAALDGLQFLPSTHYVGAAGLAVSVSEGSNTASGSTAITVNPVAHTPSVTAASTNENTQSTSGLVITPNTLDGSLSGDFQITGITGGSLYESDGVTPIIDGQFITFAQGEAGLQFNPTADSTVSGAFDVQASTSNTVGGLGGSVVAAAITVNPVPTLAMVATASTNEDAPLTFSNADSNAITVGDPGNSAGPASVTLTATDGTLSLASVAGITISVGSASGASSDTITGSFASLDAALDGLQFLPSTHYVGAAGLAVSVTEGSNTASSSTAITVNPVAHTPSVAGAQTIETAQTTSGLVITPNPLDSSLSGYFQITAITNGTLFQADGTTPITSGEFITFAQGEAGLTFTPNAGSAITGSFAVQASTSANVSGLGGSQVTGTISIARTPTVTVESTPLSFIEGDSAESVSPGLTISQPNGTPLTGATVRLNGYVAGQDALQFVDQNGITSSWNSSTGVLTLSGTASAATYQSALQSVTYFNSSADPSQASRSVQFTVMDALLTSLSATRTLNVVAVNNAPTIAAPATQSTVEDVGLTFSAASGNAIVVADVDSEGQPEQVTITASAGTLATAADPAGAAATLTFTGTISQLNQQLDGLTFTPGLHDFHPATITVSIDDLGNTGAGGPKTAVATIAVYVAPVAHTPSVTDASTTEGSRTNGGLVITPNPFDQGLAGYYQITSITGGTLVQSNGVTPVNDGDFITFAQGAAGLRFTPSPQSLSDGSFTAQASVSSSVAGLGGAAVTATISVTPLPLVVRSASLEVQNGAMVTLTSSELKVASPAGVNDAIVYTILSLPTQGTLLLDGTALGVNGTFTSADVSSGAVQYVSANRAASSDGFQFVATDAAGRTSGASAFQIAYAPAADIPTQPITPQPPAGPITIAPPDVPESIISVTPSGGTVTPPPQSTWTDTTTVTPAAVPAAPVVPSAVVAAGHVAAVAPRASVVAAPEPSVLANPVVASVTGPIDLTPNEVAAVQKTFDAQSGLWFELDEMKQQMISQMAFKAWAGTASFVSVGMSLAYFLWMFRAGALVTSLLSSLPAWNFVDPLPILNSMGSSGGGADDDEGLESMLTGKKKSG